MKNEKDYINDIEITKIGVEEKIKEYLQYITEKMKIKNQDRGDYALLIHYSEEIKNMLEFLDEHKTKTL